MKERYCSACGQDISPGEMSVLCRLCMGNYHAGCWEKAGGCTTFGCAGKPALEKEGAANSYKRCPNCGEKNVSFAVKCRYCRHVLDNEALQKASLPGLKKEQSFRKDPILTGLLNLIFPGAGYMYLGHFNKGLLWFLAAMLAFFFTRWIGMMAVYLWVIYDSSRQAVYLNRGGPPPPKRKVSRR